MSTSVRHARHGAHRDASTPPGGLAVRRALLSCGILYAVLYPIANDVVAASIYDGYSRMSQAVSELSATGAPPRPFLVSTLPVFCLLQVGFGVGMWQSARDRRAVRIAAVLMIGHGAMSLLWLFAPMSRREVLAAGGATSADSMHLVLSAATGVFVAGYVAVFALAFGWLFRAYSALTVATSLVFGMLSAQVEKIEAGDPTPFMGLLERIGIGAWLLWLAVSSLVLLREQRPPRR